MLDRWKAAVLAVAVACITLVMPPIASAARTGVTIHHRARDHFYGYVFSPNPHRCAQRRIVNVYRQTGKTQDRKRDKRINGAAARKTNKNGKFRWRLLSEQRHGKFYAHASKIPGCEPDSSRTIHL